MPSYDYKCKECEHIWEDSYTIANRNKPLEEACPNCGKTGCVSRWIGESGIAIGDVVRLGLKHPDSGFSCRMREIAKKHDSVMKRSTAGKLSQNVTEV